MSKFKKKPKSEIKKDLTNSVADLQKFSKEELITRVRQLEAHVIQLKNVIKKQSSGPETASVNAKRSYDFSKCHKRHILLKFLYMGWDYHGYAVQEDSVNTIEDHLFEALTRSCLIQSRQTSNYHRCGRTDKGVSAFSQVISIEVRSCLSAETEGELEKELPYCVMLNRILPENIRMVAWKPTPDSTFSARFDCTKRTYRYYFPRSNLNLNLIQEASNYMIGEHDFRNLCKLDVGNGVLDYTRTIFETKVQLCDYSQCKASDSPFDICELIITGKAFLWHQIRCIVSILFLVGSGKESPDIIKLLLNPEKCPSKPQYKPASEMPLCLFLCEYDSSEEWYEDKKELARTVRQLQAMWAQYAVKAEVIKGMLHDLEDKLDLVVFNHNACIMQENNCKMYKPLLDRDTCSSLPDRIQHYVKRRKFEANDQNTSSVSQMDRD